MHREVARLVDIAATLDGDTRRAGYPAPSQPTSCRMTNSDCISQISANHDRGAIRAHTSKCSPS